MFIMSKQSLFAFKTALLVAMVSLPAFLKSSAGWYYYDRGLWVAIMATLTHSQHRVGLIVLQCGTDNPRATLCSIGSHVSCIR